MFEVEDRGSSRHWRMGANVLGVDVVKPRVFHSSVSLSSIEIVLTQSSESF